MIQSLQLNLPNYNFRIETTGETEKIWDVVRKKWVVLTPEEWVRQHFIHLLHLEFGYPLSRFKVEKGHRYQSKRKRTDIEILDDNGDIFLLLECKAPTIKLSPAMLNQCAVYNQTIRAKLLMVSNGIRHFIWKYDQDDNSYIQIQVLPHYQK